MNLGREAVMSIHTEKLVPLRPLGLVTWGSDYGREYTRQPKR